MDLKNIEAIIALAKKEGLSSLQYETKEFKIAVVLPGESVPLSLPRSRHAVANDHSQDGKEGKGGKGGAAKIAEDPNIHKITSPFVGTFYTSSSPGESAYIKHGDKVRKGQTLCIVEAMKIMNEIDSDIAGEVVEICVENESLVEYGQVLFIIRTVRTQDK